MTKFKLKRLIRARIVFFILPFFIVACIKDNTSELENESNMKFEKLKKKYSMTSADSIAPGVYWKSIGDTAEGASPINTDFVIMAYTGKNSDDELIETSDSATAKGYDQYYYDFIYGPTKVYVGNTLYGIYIVLTQKLAINDSAVIVMSANAGIGNYTPVAYTVALYHIIKDDKEFETEQRDAYKAALGFTGKFNEDSTIEYRMNNTSATASNIDYNKRVTITLHAYYAEWVDGILNKVPGREFFPINKSTDSVRYYYQVTTGFPLTVAIDSMVSVMNIGEEREFITTSDNAYGENGFFHPQFGNVIVPRYTSIHYKMKLVKVE
jgi:FKBP-type peptidyl-prolyl cis-trans isomerase 2